LGGFEPTNPFPLNVALLSSVHVIYKKKNSPLDLCHSISLRPPFSALQASTWPVASIFSPCFNSIQIPYQHYGRFSILALFNSLIDCIDAH